MERCNLVFAIVLLALSPSCSEDESLPPGPCNDDGDTAGDANDVGEAEPVPNTPKVAAPPASPAPITALHPGLTVFDGWNAVPGLDGIVRYATIDEKRRFSWPDYTLIVATPFSILDHSESGWAWLSVPSWLDEQGQWKTDETGLISFERQRLVEVQTLALGYFVEHASTSEGQKSPAIHRPTFDLFGAEDVAEGRRMRLLTDSFGGFVFRLSEPSGALSLSYPHTQKKLDIPAPIAYGIAIVSPSDQSIMHAPLMAYDCENGDCEDPDDPLDECSDSIDNDGDGHRDLCDWNCLPHADFGADAFPEAHSRVENGKTYALLGGGTICTDLQDVWMVTFADWALDATEFFTQIRPEHDDRIRYRIFSCWIFEDKEALQLCQHGPFEPKEGPLEEDECAVVWTGDPICPPGLEDYPYQPTETELVLSASEFEEFCADRNRHYFDEIPERTWRDLEINTAALKLFGEPVNGVIHLTSDLAQVCLEGELCGGAAGLAYVSPNASIKNLGFASVSNLNPVDWLTLAHESAHTVGLEHGTAENGFMNTSSGTGDLPILDEANSGIWANSMAEKGWLPRSSGWFHTGCTGFDECAPLGKPGWSCVSSTYCRKD